MSTNAICLVVDGACLQQTLQQACEKLESAGAEMLLDFTSVRRLDAAAVTALQKLAATADAKAAKVSLRGVNVDVYKVLKLMKASSNFSFLS